MVEERRLNQTVCTQIKLIYIRTMIVLWVTGHMEYGRQYIMLGRQRPQEGSHSMDFDQQMICTVILNLVSGQENLSIQCQSLPLCFSPVCHVFCLTNLFLSQLTCFSLSVIHIWPNSTITLPCPISTYWVTIFLSQLMCFSVYNPYLANQCHN